MTNVSGMASLPDADLLDIVQRQTLKYFTDFAHPVSGMARERSNKSKSYNTYETVTTGGTGFGIMAMIAGAERGFITKDEALARIGRIVAFLEKADRFHGVFPHFMNGTTGKTIPFSRHDDGGDIVETSFLMQGLLTARQYFSGSGLQEQKLRDKINALWEGVEWNWHTQGQDALYWHWSPNAGWGMNHNIHGWNECLITFVLAASSPTHPISADVYHKGWTNSPVFNNGHSYNGITLPLGPPQGGPLFFSHYSFLGLDPRGLKDRYADYWDQNVSHTLVNRDHCIDNPKGYKGYGPVCWGLTASDGDKGYSAHAPDNDRGVITPTAALSAMPYTPKESMGALRHFFNVLSGQVWGPYGFRDAFNESAGWVANSNLAIDQGPIVAMIENHRSGLLWNLFMSAPEVKAGLQKLGFQSPYLGNTATVSMPKP